MISSLLDVTQSSIVKDLLRVHQRHSAYVFSKRKETENNKFYKYLPNSYSMLKMEFHPSDRKVHFKLVCGKVLLYCTSKCAAYFEGFVPV